MKRRFPAWTSASSSRARGNVELGDGLAVDLDAALRDQTPRLARRADAEVLDEQRRQMDGSPGGSGASGTSSGASCRRDDAREVLLGLGCGFRPVRALDDESGERELRSHRIARRRSCSMTSR